MHKVCKCPCMISEACNTYPWFFSNEYEILKVLTIFILTHCSLSPFVEIVLWFINCTFSPLCDFTWFPPKSLFSASPFENLDEIQRCSELLQQNGLRHHVRRILLHADLHQVDHLVIYNPLTYLMIPYINVLHSLVIHVIIRKMKSTLTVAMNPNWIMHYTKSLDQSSQPQSSFDASTVTMYLASVVERAIVSCNFAFQLMTHWTNVNT